MDILFYLATASLVLFMLLATFDGFYLHIWKYRLFDRTESLFEHKTHTVRAILFPLIVWLLFIEETSFLAFIIGSSLVVLDIIVLGIDAYHEKESRNFMGGLPTWEYIVHLFANAFHFAAIIIVLALKFEITNASLVFVNNFTPSTAYHLFHFVSANIIPGAIVLAILHFILMLKTPKRIWLSYRSKVTCC